MNNNKEKLKSDEFLNDPRVKEGKKLILEALADHQKELKISQAKSSLKKQYEELLKNYAQIRGANLWFPYIGSGFGKGPLVELCDGSVKYDFITGIGPNYLGHCHPDIVSTGIDAALSDSVMQGNLQQNIDSLELSELLIKYSNLDHCFLTTSGAMANENAIKLIFQKKAPASRVLAFDRCFMGRSWAMSQISDKPAYRDGLPYNILVDYIPYFDPYDPEKSIQKAVFVLKKLLHRHPKEYAFMCFELIQGDGGFYAGSKEFFKALMTVLKENGVAIFIDEIQTFGRTEKLFAFQHFELDAFADVVTVGKLLQACATLFTKDYKPRPGLLSQTFTASTSCIKAGKEIITLLVNGDFFGPNGKNNKVSLQFTERFMHLEREYPGLIEGPYGMGAMIGFTPFNGDASKVQKFVLDLFDAGVLSFITGTNPTRARFLPPVGSLSKEDINKVMEIVEKVLTKAIV